MALKGKAKTDYQRDYMRRKRSNKPVLDLPVRPKEDVKAIPPLYNPSIHRAGDLVIVQKGKRYIEMVIPEIDADGNAVYIGDR